MDPNETLNEAIKRSCPRPAGLRHFIDSEGMLVPDTRQYDRIREMIEIWIRPHGPDKALDTDRNSAKYLKVWWKVL